MFKGNQSELFLGKVDPLKKELLKETLETQTKGLPYIQTFPAFSAVVSDCFGVTLTGDYSSSISQFKEKYGQLGITITTKVTKLYFHHIYLRIYDIMI